MNLFPSLPISPSKLVSHCFTLSAWEGLAPPHTMTLTWLRFWMAFCPAQSVCGWRTSPDFCEGLLPNKLGPSNKSVLLWDKLLQPLVWHTDVPMAEFLQSLPAWHSRLLRTKLAGCSVWIPCIRSGNCLLVCTRAVSYPPAALRGDPSPTLTMFPIATSPASPAATASGCWIKPQSTLCRGPPLHYFLDPGDKSSSSLWSLPGGPTPCKSGQTWHCGWLGNQIASEGPLWPTWHYLDHNDNTCLQLECWRKEERTLALHSWTHEEKGNLHWSQLPPAPKTRRKQWEYQSGGHSKL